MIADPIFKLWIKFVGMAAYACNPSTQQAESGGLRVQSQSWLHGKILSQNKKTKKIKVKKINFSSPRRIISCRPGRLMCNPLLRDTAS